jgi:hypothetical protein
VRRDVGYEEHGSSSIRMCEPSHQFYSLD